MARRQGIQRLRLNALLTQKEFAAAMGVSVQSVQSWESGLSIPRPAKMRQMLPVLGVTREQLVEAVEDTQRERAESERERQRAVADRATRKRNDD